MPTMTVFEDNVLLRPLRRFDVPQTSLILPGSILGGEEHGHNLNVGELLAAGPGRKDEHGNTVPPINELADIGTEVVYIKRFENHLPDAHEVVVRDYDILLYKKDEHWYPNFNRVMIEPTRTEEVEGTSELASGLIVVRKASPKKPKADNLVWGRVIGLSPVHLEELAREEGTTVGYGRTLDYEGTLTVDQLEVQVGDEVLYRQYSRWGFELNGQDVFVVNYEDIRMKVETDDG